jgi:uncharacterized protein (TIGR00661 family)
MNILFIIQDEGNGHLTHAKYIADCLKGTNFNLVGAITSKHLDDIKTFNLEKPKFYKNLNGRISLRNTIFFNLWNIRKFIKTAKKIDDICIQYNVHLIVNFYDIISPLYKLFFNRCKVDMISISHQYEYSSLIKEINLSTKFKIKNIFNHLSYKLLNYFNSLGSYEKCIISMQDKKKSNYRVLPPLFNQKILSLVSLKKNFICVNLSSNNHTDMFLKFAFSNPDFRFRWHTDIKRSDLKVKPSNIMLKNMSDDVFFSNLSECNALITTADFDNICAAKYLGKPIIIKPITNHYEQLINYLYYTHNKITEKWEINKSYMFVDKGLDNEYIIWVKSAKIKIIELFTDYAMWKNRQML